MLPNYLNPYPDELLYSWVNRLALANVLSNRGMEEYYLGRPRAAQCGKRPTYDLRNEFYHLYSHLLYAQGAKDLYWRTTTFPFEANFMTVEQQSRYLDYVFRPADKFVPAADSLFQTIKMCEQCVEESDEPYIKRSHQLTGVCTCHKHKTLLLEYRGKRENVCNYDFSEFAPCQPSASMESELAYTDYAKALFEADLNTSLDKIRRLILSKYSGQNLDEMKADWKYKDLIAYDDKKFKFNMARKISIGAKGWVSLLMLFVPNVNECCDLLRSTTDIIIERICPICGTNYCTTAFAESIGRGCPQCDQRLDDQERYRKMVQYAGNGLYEVVGEFSSMSLPVKHRHLTCGRELVKTPPEFLYRGVRCECERVLTEERVSQEVEAYDGFHLVKLEDVERHRHIIVHHDACGKDFRCMYDKFINTPMCRFCQSTRRPFERKIKSLVGDEYTLESEYVRKNGRVDIRHNKCGNVQSYIPSRFLAGQRCSECEGRAAMSRDIWMDWFECLKRYNEAEGSANPPVTLEFEERKLGLWCATQRDRLKNGLLSDERIKLLESIGFDWDRTESNWYRRFEIYKEFIAEHGQTEYYSQSYHGAYIGQWAQAQRDAYKDGLLPADKVEKLNSIGFDWSRNTRKPMDETWERNYALYAEHLKKYGKVGKNVISDGVNISEWMRWQRKQYRKGKLLPEREEKLRQIVPEMFEWAKDPQKALDDTWKKKCEMYAEYLKEHGAVTKDAMQGDVHLGNWIHQQRKDYRKGTLKPEREQMLRQVDPDMFDRMDRES